MGRCFQLVPPSCICRPADINVAVGHHQVFPAIVVVVEEGIAPTEEGDGDFAEGRCDS